MGFRLEHPLVFVIIEGVFVKNPPSDTFFERWDIMTCNHKISDSVHWHCLWGAQNVVEFNTFWYWLSIEQTWILNTASISSCQILLFRRAFSKAAGHHAEGAQQARAVP